MREEIVEGAQYLALRRVRVLRALHAIVLSPSLSLGYVYSSVCLWQKTDAGRIQENRAVLVLGSTTAPSDAIPS